MAKDLLTDLQIRNAKPKEKPYPLRDGAGLNLLVHNNGSKYWRLRYELNGKENTYAIGVYPEVTIKEARIERDRVKKILKQGIDPNNLKAQEKLARSMSAENSFEVIAKEWLEKMKGESSDTHYARIHRMIEKDLNPYIGRLPISDITAPQILAAAKKVEVRGAIESARRTVGVASQVFRYAIASGRADRDPCPGLKGALRKPKKRHFAAITKPQEASYLLKAIDSYFGNATTKAALKFAPLVFARPGEVRGAKWSEIDLKKGVWEYFVSKGRKSGHSPKEHLVPLSRQAIQILEDIQKVSGGGELVFPGVIPKKPLSENTLNLAIRRLGYDQSQMTSHGFRAMARTLLAEELGISPDIIELQLSHTVPDRLKGAYNRVKFIEERKKLMQSWADYLDDLRTEN